jgi:galactose mutarotase-like enzyme
MNVSINPTSWHGQEAWTIESEILRTIIVPTMGAKLVSLFDKRSQREWLAGPGRRPFQKVPYGASFVDQDMSGWDEMIPTIVACDYPVPGAHFGLPLPDHGEVWPLTWTRDPTGPHVLRYSVMGRALPYRLARTLSYSAPDTLQMAYELQNLGQERQSFIWAAHPQFLCGETTKIVLPAYVNEVCNVLPPEWGWGEPETRFSWPEALDVNGQRARIDRTGPASLKRARKYFVPPEVPVSCAGILRLPYRDWLRLDWDADLVPYLGIWIDEGAINQETVVALEPMTGFYDSLASAWEKNLVRTIEPGETQTWTLRVRAGADAQPFPMDE